MEDQKSIVLQMHYYFKDVDAHSMNAAIHNECEKQFIKALKLLNKYVDTAIVIKVRAKDQGGLKVIYEVCTKDPLVLIIITALITSTINQFFTSNFRPAINATEETKNRIENVASIKEMIKAGTLTDEEFDYYTENDKDLKKLKSNFFKSAKQEESITKIEFEDISPNRKPAFSTRSIEYADFDKCIIVEEQEINDIEIDAKIYIVSPVLIKKNYNWKGIYNDEPIDFSIKDKDFLNDVYNHVVKFCNGTYINCRMKIIRTVNKNDGTEKIERIVLHVDNCHDDDGYIMIKKHRKAVNNPDQLTLFEDGEF